MNTLYHATPALVEAYQSSTKQDTDDFATRIIVQAGDNLHEVEEDAMWIAQHVWNTSIENLPPQFYNSFRYIIKTLGEPNIPIKFEDVVGDKECQGSLHGPDSVELQ